MRVSAAFSSARSGASTFAHQPGEIFLGADPDQGNALGGGRPAQQGAAPTKRMTASTNPAALPSTWRRGHVAPVLVRPPPLRIVRVDARHIPDRDGIVSQVVVQLDQPGNRVSPVRIRSAFSKPSGAAADTGCTARIRLFSMKMAPLGITPAGPW